MNVFEKIKKVCLLVNDIYPDMALPEIKCIVGFLANHWHGNKRQKRVILTQQQLTIYELLLGHGYKPMTVYKWLLIASAPEPIQEKVREGVISFNQALKEKHQGRTYLQVNEQKFLRAIISCVETYFSGPMQSPMKRLEQ